MTVPIESIFFSKDLVEECKRQLSVFYAISRVYRSNWRVLHIDGFEGGCKLPIHAGEVRKFFHYEESK